MDQIKNIQQGEELQQIDLFQYFNKVLKIMIEREENYFRIFEFIKKNMEISEAQTAQTQQMTILNQFLNNVQNAEQQLIKQQQVLINQQRRSTIKNKKYILQNIFRLINRLSARIYQFFETSIAKTRNTFFFNATVDEQYRFFKDQMNQIISLENMFLIELITIVLKYSKSKFDRQFKKLNNYLGKVQNGHQIFLKQFYIDIIPQKQHKQIKNERKNNNHHSKSPQHKKQPQKIKEIQKKQKILKSSAQKYRQAEEIRRIKKYNFLNKMMKIYSVIDPSRPHFYQDFMYQSHFQSYQKSKILYNLKLKNKQISDQIMTYHRKTQAYNEHFSSLKNLEYKEELTESPSSSLQKTSLFKNTKRKNNFFNNKTKKQFYHKFSEKEDSRQLAPLEFKNTQMINSVRETFSSCNEYGSESCTQNLYEEKYYAEQSNLTNFNKHNLLPNLNQHTSRYSWNKGLKQLKKIETKPPNPNRIFVVKAPILFENQNLKGNLVVLPNQLAELTRRNSLLELQQKLGPNLRKLTRKILHQDSSKNYTKKTVLLINEKKLQDQTNIEVDASQKLRREYNLRYKNYLKRNMLSSDDVVLERLHQQINKQNT